MYIVDKKISILIKKTKPELDDLILKAIKSPLGYLILLQGFYLAILSLQLPEKIGQFEIAAIVKPIYILSISFILLYFVFKIINIIAYYLHKEAKKTESTLDDQLVPLLVKSLRILVVTVGILFILQNFGYNVTSLLAGLGIGGLAFALAAQNTVSNLFGSITIFSDKPFQLGDWIQVGDIEGTVEDVGFRTTRVRRFDQALVTVPNSLFINTGVVNYSAMKKRRITFNIGVTYGTSVKKINEAVAGIKRIIEGDEKFDHSFYMVRFNDFGTYSLNIFIYCFTSTTDWAESLRVKEEFNLKIMQLFEDLGVEIALPSQKIYLNAIKGGN
ncbi:MAG: mechanosensitive ion channel family protein [Candidatus Methanoperedens sp.]|nr:mechanosensitive ion channel family protein [Candidatus Methanoperedens sp.]